MQDGGSLTIPLSRPIPLGDETLSEITLSEVDLGSLEGVNIVISDEGDLKLNLGDLHRLVAAMAKIPPSSAKKITIRDALAAREKIADFFGISLPIGGSS